MTLAATLSTAVATAVVLLSLVGCKPKDDAGPAPDASTASTASMAGTAGTVERAQAASLLTVELVSPQTQSWPRTVQANGSLAAWQEVIVSPETGGLRVAELLVDVGTRVRRGQVLARLADEGLRNDLAKRQALVAQAEASLAQAVSNARRAQDVESTGGLSAQSIEQYRITEATSRASLDSARADLAATQLQLRQTRIVAPDDGLVASRTGVLGNVVSAGAELFRLVRQHRVEWRAEVDARQLAELREGQPARVRLPTGQTIDGRVRLVGPVLSTDTGRALVYVSLSGDSPARAGMFADGTIELPATAALTLPQTALVGRDGRDYVYLVASGDTVRSVAVTVGRRRGDRVELVRGLQAGARVVASGGAFLSDGARVTVAGSRPAGETATTVTPATTATTTTPAVSLSTASAPSR